METQMLVSGNSNRQSSLFERKIEFHMARKPFSGVVNFDSKFQLETLNPTVLNGNLGLENKSMTQLPSNKTEGISFGRNGFDPELSFGITFRRIGAGLENLGNTCFLNSVLQCLTYTEPLVAYLQSGRHQSSCQIAGFCALCAIQKHVSRALHATGRSLAPKDLVSNLRCISRTFRNARQEDAHEYMVHLLESMHRCCLPKGVPSESPSAYEKSLVHKIFGGRLQSQVRCMQCTYRSNKYDPFLDLSLEIAKADTLQKALGHFTAKDHLDGGAKQYHCEQCKQKVRAFKQLTIHEAPYVLTIHLKRFCAHDPRQKIDKKVVFSPTLDLKPFVSGSHEGSLMYTLYGVLVHAGWSTRSGHYYCFVRTSTGMWYNLDDNRVVQVNERTVLEQKAYMLFYVRDRKNIAPKKPFNDALNAMMASNANGKNILSSIANGLKSVGEKGSLEKLVDKEKSVTATKDAMDVKGTKEEVPFINSTAKTNNATHTTNQPELAVSAFPNDISTVSKSKVVESLPPTGLPNKDCASKEEVYIQASILPGRSIVQLPENKKPVIAENLIVADGCSLGGNMSFDSSKEVCDSKVSSIVSVRQPLALPSPSKTNDLMEVPECNTMNAPKRRFRKPLVITMRLSTNFMSGSSRLHKKKLKRSRRAIFKNQSCNKKILETVESTSEIVSVDPFGQKKRKTRSEEKFHNPVNEELHSKNTPSKEIKAEHKAQSEPGYVGNKTVTCGLSNEIRGDSAKCRVASGGENVSSLYNRLKRGLDEPIVARWDGTLSSTEHLISMPSECTRIGYVADEWDEEYDRGRRKKVKLPKESYEGRNPFQQFADNKTSSKKLKRDRTSSGNLPYRIP